MKAIVVQYHSASNSNKMPPKPPGPLPMHRSTRIINKKSQHVERDSSLSNQTYVGWKNVGQSRKEDGSESNSSMHPTEEKWQGIGSRSRANPSQAEG
jgi:hypothetical protein